MNEQNLKPGAHKFTREEQSRAGKRSAEVRRNRKAVKQAILDALYAENVTGTGTEMESMIAGMMRRVKEMGDPAAWEKLMQYAGMSPEEKRKAEEQKLRREELEFRKVQTDSGQEAAIRARAAVMQKVREELQKNGGQ